MTSVDTPSRACLGSTRRIGEVSTSRVRFARDQSVVRSPLWARIDLSVPPGDPGLREALHVKLSKRKSALVATAIAAAMLMTACGGSDDSGDSGAAAEGGS